MTWALPADSLTVSATSATSTPGTVIGATGRIVLGRITRGVRTCSSPPGIEASRSGVSWAGPCA